MKQGKYQHNQLKCAGCDQMQRFYGVTTDQIKIVRQIGALLATLLKTIVGRS